MKKRAKIRDWREKGEEGRVAQGIKSGQRRVKL